MYSLIIRETKTYDVVNLKNGTDGFRSQSDSTGSHQKWLCYSFIQHVSNSTLNNIKYVRNYKICEKQLVLYHTLRTLIPDDLNPQACLFLKSVTVAIGLRPAFSANVMGITSNDSAYALQPLKMILVPTYHIINLSLTVGNKLQHLAILVRTGLTDTQVRSLELHHRQ